MQESDKFPEADRSDPRSTTELIAAAACLCEDDEEYWQLVKFIGYRFPEIFPKIVEMAVSEKEKERSLAASVLGQNLAREKWDPEKCCDQLLAMLRSEQSEDVIAAALLSLGHLRDPRAVEPILHFKNSANSDVRFTLVFALLDSANPRAIATVIELSADEDRKVRNWATFGLGTLFDIDDSGSLIEIDTPEIREALMARVNETDDEVRGEAIAGLARRGDSRVIDLLSREIDDPSRLERWHQYCWPLIDDAAEAIAERVMELADGNHDQKWLLILEKCRAHSIGDAAEIAKAIARYKTG